MLFRFLVGFCPLHMSFWDMFDVEGVGGTIRIDSGNGLIVNFDRRLKGSSA